MLTTQDAKPEAVLRPFVHRYVQRVSKAGEGGHLLATFKMADPTPTLTKWKRLHNAFVERQNHSHTRRAVNEFSRQALRRERNSEKPDRFEAMRIDVKRALAFSGLAVRANGTILGLESATTLTEAQRRADQLKANLIRRGVHPDVLHFCRAKLVADNYFHAVLEATKALQPSFGFGQATPTTAQSSLT